MNKIIWTCWFQGRQNAPPLVKKCLDRWEVLNPDWEFRCLDASTIERYVPLRRFVDLDVQALTAASLSDVLRILLLHEYGGVWVDATLYCNKPLNSWLPELMDEGFFAFAKPAPGRPLSSWFLSAESQSLIVSRWCAAVLDYWCDRPRTHDYFWFHALFRSLIENDPDIAESWARAPSRSADPPHALQWEGRMFQPYSEVADLVDWSTPVFKLTHRLPENALSSDTLLNRILDDDSGRTSNAETPHASHSETVGVEDPFQSFASLRISTGDLGDYIRIVASNRLLDRLRITPDHLVDQRAMPAPPSGDDSAPTGTLLHDWFEPIREKRSLNARSSSFLHPVLRAPELIEFVSTLTFSRRIAKPLDQTDVFVVSRDERIAAFMPETLKLYTFMTHRAESSEFLENLERAEARLRLYAGRAKLVVTTLLHCALPAIAMGIPVVAFYPLNEAGRAFDRQRFSMLDALLPIYDVSDIARVDWSPEPIDVSTVKLRVLDDFYRIAERWHLPPATPLGPIAPASLLPPG